MIGQPARGTRASRRSFYRASPEPGAPNHPKAIGVGPTGRTLEVPQGPLNEFAVQKMPRASAVEANGVTEKGSGAVSGGKRSLPRDRQGRSTSREQRHSSRPRERAPRPEESRKRARRGGSPTASGSSSPEEDRRGGQRRGREKSGPRRRRRARSDADDLEDLGRAPRGARWPRAWRSFCARGALATS